MRGAHGSWDIGRMVRCRKAWNTYPMHGRDGVAVLLALLGVSSLDFGPLSWAAFFLSGMRVLACVTAALKHNCAPSLVSCV